MTELQLSTRWLDPDCLTEIRPSPVFCAIKFFKCLAAAHYHQLRQLAIALQIGRRAMRRSVRIQRHLASVTLDELWLPQSVVNADIVVSTPKVKTHHWAGVILSMKNMFGIVPGAVYGWPKNVLHWLGIEKSILDFCSTLRPSLVIADGIVATEGNGPLHGSGRALNRIVLSDAPVAADFACTRLMELLPEKIYRLEQAARFLGNGAVEATQMLGESLPETVAPFSF